jgi:hypothetical protein
MHLLPSTSMAITLLPGTGACPPALTVNASVWYDQPDLGSKTCNSSRGNIYYRNRDKDVQNILGGPADQLLAMSLGDYQTFSNVGYNMSAYGIMSNLSFGYEQSSSTVKSSIQIPAAEFNQYNYTWTGLLALDGRPANFTTMEDGNDTNPKITHMYKSLLGFMKDTNVIPNLSWGYTAGSYNSELSGFDNFGLCR